ncbi:MFS transporter [Dyadobacter jiangsuensis]|uniref:Putative MFS family arabinose efflux permease n=1 Tax=Dyadobacter jiangsuensis TaxID=1591085 RepID=A0A2P8GIH2_9BACT|nr:MFS transporter [Dyadobacter jiangsuensis]PSL33758.1 putative MFS family arabinose efflux permease [Dyadobacter jiangsuensis]
MNTIVATGEENTFAKFITPIIISVFAVYLTMGMTLGVLPGFVQNDLHFGSLVVGIVVGLQSLATLLTRAYSGTLTDTRGAKTSNYLGIALVAVAGAVYTCAVMFGPSAGTTLALLIVARIVHGVSESLSVTGSLTWGIGLVGAPKSGKVMTWNGIAMYAGIALGAPLAIWMRQAYGIQYVFASMILLSGISWMATFRLPALKVDGTHIRTPFYKIIGLISGQGLGLAFASIGFACISSFISLLFNSRSWGNPSLAFVTFGACYVLTRVFFSSFPDRFGGYRVALVSLMIELCGQLLIRFAPSPELAIAGCGLTGVGFSLVFPALAVLAIQKVAPQMRGTALGAYAAFFDLSLGLAGPVAGVIAGWAGYASVYLFGAVSCLMAVIVLLGKNREAGKAG